MRVILIGSYGPSLLNFRGPLISALITSGHEVHVAAPEIDADLLVKLQNLGAIVHETPLNRKGTNFFSDVKYLAHLSKLLRSVGPDLVITYTVKPNIWGAFAGALVGIKTASLITGLGIAFTDTGREETYKVGIIKFIVRRLYRQAANFNWRVIFQNPDDLSDFDAAGCLTDRSKARIINGSGVELADFPPAPSPKTVSFLMVSRILGSKGVREYAIAALKTKKVFPEISFKLVGFFDEGPDAISQSELSEWTENGLEYFGPSEDIQPFFANTLIFVLPSYREGTPRSVLEAMATGRAILTTDAPGCRETVVSGLNGYLVPVRDTDVLATRMQELIENPLLAEKMGQESLKIVKLKYEVGKVNAQLLSHLEL